MEELLAKYFTGEATIDERSLVEKWRSQSETNAKTFFEAKIIWLNSTGIKPTTESFFDKKGNKANQKSLQIWMISSQWSKYVAAAILVLAIGLLFILNRANELSNVEVLSDGSEIHLHHNSSMQVIKMDETSREVKISGKAYFDIAHDVTRPFAIYSENAKVVVLGTSFVVETDETKTIVSVEDGTVELTKDTNVSVRLEKGDMGIASNMNKGIIKKPNENTNYLSWKTKLITFRGASMQEVAVLLEDVYQVQIQFDNTEFKNCRLTAQIQKKSLKEALEIISRTFEVDYQLKNNVATFSGRGC